MAQKIEKIFFSNMNQIKLYFPILVLDQQGVKIVSPYWIASLSRKAAYLPPYACPPAKPLVI
jgi:hypothetical protein